MMLQYGRRGDEVRNNMQQQVTKEALQEEEERVSYDNGMYHTREVTEKRISAEYPAYE